MSTRFTLFVPFCVAIVCGSTLADIVFTANITNDQENPPTNPTTSGGQPRPASFGTATFVLNDAMTQMVMDVEVHNIDFTGSQTADTNDNLTAAHIHAGLNNPPLNNGVVWGFIGTPFNDNNPTDTVVTPFVGDVGATIHSKWDAPEGNAGTTLTAQLANIFAGRAYINFHTVQFAGGEIRGAIVPEPAFLGIFALGAMGLVRRARR